MYKRQGKRCPFFGRWCRRYAAYFTAVGAAVYTTARVNAVRFFGRGCQRYVAQFSAVSAAFDTTVRVIATRFASAVGVSVMLPMFLLLVPPFTLR